MANALEGVIENLDNDLTDFLSKELESVFEPVQAFKDYLCNVGKVISIYKETKVMPDFDFDNWENSQAVDVEAFTENGSRNSLKENVRPIKTEEEAPKGRPRRNAFKEASQNINKISGLSLATKLRRSDNLVEAAQNVYIKQEKTSIPEVKVKTEAEEMPAPTRPAPKTKKKAKKTETKVKVKEEKRESDVIIEDTEIPLVNLVDSDNEKNPQNEKIEESVRTTRTKTRQKKLKRAKTKSSSDEDQQDEKRQKSDVNDTFETCYEDAVEVQTEKNDATFIATKSTPANQNPLNVTVTIEKSKYMTNNVNDLLTDDDSDQEKGKSPPKTLTKTVTKSKPVFSPFEQSPVKKKVQAFEKLTEQANAIPVRVTRTKTRANEKKAEEESQVEPPKNTVKDKAKLFTPMAIKKFFPSASSTTVKPSKLNSTPSNESLLFAKSMSALKASRDELRKRREKEEEALKKREALMQASIEEKKRKREEKQLKAQQQREALEKEKLKALEVQRLKDERHKQVLAEQEQKKQKQKEEAEKKRMLAKMRAIEEKKKEEEKRQKEQLHAAKIDAKLKKDEDILKLAESKNQRTVPVYMKTKAPLLPTQDCYDSDDEEYASHIRLPSWTNDGNLKNQLQCMDAVGGVMKNTFFSRQAQSANLVDIFEVIEATKLKRSSSALWLKPPRYTMMPALEGHPSEFDEEDEDSDELFRN